MSGSGAGGSGNAPPIFPSVNIKNVFGMSVREAHYSAGKFVLACPRKNLGIETARTHGAIMGRLMAKCEAEGLFYSSQFTKTDVIYRIGMESFKRVEELFVEAETEFHALKTFSGLGD